MRAVILGAGPAGLAAAHDLAKRGAAPVVLEKASCVGGICRTICYKGYYFDMGGHRFFTKYPEVQALWEEILGDAFLVRPRMSRIYYGGKFYDYPLKATNALRNLGLLESTRCMASYAKARLRPRGEEHSFEQWVSNRFGDRLFDIFFRSYTEKVWGIPTSEIGADWAAQRIKNMELSTAVKQAISRPIKQMLGRGGTTAGGEVVSSLIEQFHYPPLGPGQMYDAMQVRVNELGGEVRLNNEVVKVLRKGTKITGVRVRTEDGKERLVKGAHYLSSMPLTLLIRAMSPAAPEDVLAAANALTFRNLLTINLIVDAPDLFPDNWIYVHEPQLQLGRIQNYKNWSPQMVPDADTTSLGLEYFCSDHEPLWQMSTEELLALGREEITKTGLLKGARITDGTVYKVPKAYPVYKQGYEQHLDKIVAFMRSFENLHPMGRYGMFKYNNSDHSIMTALLTVENLYGASHDVWAVNTETAYHEIRGS
jgi:protoporphyrinogen oxidase